MLLMFLWKRARRLIDRDAGVSIHVFEQKKKKGRVTFNILKFFLCKAKKTVEFFEQEMNIAKSHKIK